MKKLFSKLVANKCESVSIKASEESAGILKEWLGKPQAPKK
ncbi:hypothetical protein [Paenibacillus alba]|uniref:Cyclic lactone autoinducer peptide n=1 Tax=Paenibacillus alba TaxID=1197127 RepID=A0ABU6GAI9_9BACL|nr:hypothetical protein [Paenibacillus alba]MEC0231161.1 hypothetical protein [Paenibacillus alba]